MVYVLSSSELVPVTAARKVQRTAMLSVLEKAGIDPVVQVSKVRSIHNLL